MESSDHCSRQIKDAFGEMSLYEILGVKVDATEIEIKKAYKKMALIHHPDKGGDPEKFKAVCVVYSILSVNEKRKAYDDSGELDGSELSDSAKDWYDYFRQMFPKVTTSAIDDFTGKYKGSDEEKNDILRVYIQSGGNLDHIMESVMLAEDEDIERFISIIDDAIDSRDISSTTKYEKSKKKILNSATTKKRSSKHSTKESSSSSTTTSKQKKAKNDTSDLDLAQIILSNRQKNSSAGGVLSGILKKYGGEGMEEDIPDDEFNKMRENIENQRVSGRTNAKGRRS